MERAERIFGRRKGGYTADELAAYRRSRIEADNAQRRRGMPSAPISNEIQGLRGLAKADQAPEQKRSRRWFGRLTLCAGLVVLQFATATVGASLMACDRCDRPFDIFVDDAFGSCVGRGTKEQRHSLETDAARPASTLGR